MKIRLPLYAQIFGVLFLYLFTLTTIVFIGFNAQFGLGWDALIKSPLGDRVNTIADAIAGQLSSSSREHWDSVLKSYSHRHHVQFYVFSMFGHQLAGDKLVIPASVVERVPEFDPKHRPPHHNWAVFHAGEPGSSLAGPPRLLQLGRFHTSEFPPGGPGDPPGAFGAFGPGGPEDLSGPGGHPGFGGPGGPGGFGGPGGPGGADGAGAFGPPHDDPGGAGGPGGLGGPGGSGGPGGPLDPGGPDINGAAPFGDDGAHGPHMPQEFMHAHGQFMVHSQNPDRFWICTRVTLTPVGSMFPLPVVLVGISDNIWQNNMIFDSRFILESASLLVFLSVVFWWPFVHSISHSLSKLTSATEKIAEGKFETRLRVDRGDEIGRLSEAVNIMAERLATFVSGQKRFLGDISHELFSPIARLQMALELLDEDATDSQKSLVQDIREEISEMNNLVNELLAFSKAGLKGKDLELTAVNPKTIVNELVQRMNLSEKVLVKFIDDSKVIADPLMLSRALSNILRNSVRYAGDKGPITISSEKHAEQLSIIVSDCGAGVPEEALKRLTEPFFRPEASRSRSSGGVGLGLAIVKSCVEACNGTLSLRNRAQGGFEVEIRLEQA